jgi:hypothetical protein
MLFAAFAVLDSLHHRFIAWLVLGCMTVVNTSIPQPILSVREQRIQYAFYAFIIFSLVLVSIHSWDPFPPILVKIFEAIWIVLMIPFIIHGIYTHYRLFKKPGSLIS